MSEPEGSQGEWVATTSARPEERGPGSREERTQRAQREPEGSHGERAQPEGPVDVARLVTSLIRDIPDFPESGVLFRDLTPLLGDGPAFRAVADAIGQQHADTAFDVVAGVEARGFLFAAAVAIATGTGVVPVRKAGKLPYRTVRAAYQLEYGEAEIEVHQDAFARARRVLLIDDVLATGGTLAAAADLLRRAGADVVGASVVVELAALGGRARLPWLDVHAVLTG